MIPWYLNGYPLEFNGHYQINSIDNEVQLIINNANESDIGTIACYLNNLTATTNPTLDDENSA